MLFSGYRRAARPDRGGLDGGWFWTSDLGVLDGAAASTVRGRADDVINSGGEKVVPGEVESVLGTPGGVRDVVIVGVPDPGWGELVTAVIVPDDPAGPRSWPAFALRRGSGCRLRGAAAPDPGSGDSDAASGKPDRQALRAVAAGEGGRA